jgi:inorganic triphosphatase YgiF
MSHCCGSVQVTFTHLYGTDVLMSAALPTDPARAQALQSLLHEVAPVWNRQIEWAQEHSAQAVSALLHQFSLIRNELLRFGLPAESARAALDQVLQELQYQDRVTQMLKAVQDDIARLADAAHDSAALPSAEQWLQRLQSGYVMDDQHSAHSGQLQVRDGLDGLTEF